jgi:hypothetical protein
VAEALNENVEVLFTLAWTDKQVIAFNTKDFDPQVLGLLQSFARGGISAEKLTLIEKILSEEA